LKLFKKSLYFIDKLSGGRLQNAFHRLLARQIHASIDYGFVIDSLHGQKSYLAKLGSFHGTDKGGLSEHQHFPWPSHNYADLYDLLFLGRRNSVANVLEVGTGSNDEEIKGSMGVAAKPGASLFMWREFFPKAKIFGADIDPKALIFDDRIVCFEVDQTRLESVHNLARQLPKTLDLIVDDGLHEYQAGVTLFEGLRGLMDNGTLYVIEDAHVSDLLKYRQFFQAQEGLEVLFVEGRRPTGNLADNRLIVIRKNENLI
jgi:hypothetical protein